MCARLIKLGRAVVIIFRAVEDISGLFTRSSGDLARDLSGLTRTAQNLVGDQASLR